MLRHVVMFRWKHGTPPELVAEFERAFAGLPSLIPQVRALEWGTDSSVEGLAAGFSHCFLVTFDTAAERDIYLPHPAHQEFVSLISPHVEQALVFDYEPRA